jgi:hypothetical protein
MAGLRPIARMARPRKAPLLILLRWRGKRCLESSGTTSQGSLNDRAQEPAVMGLPCLFPRKQLFQ